MQTTVYSAFEVTHDDLLALRADVDRFYSSIMWDISGSVDIDDLPNIEVTDVRSSVPPVDITLTDDAAVMLDLEVTLSGSPYCVQTFAQRWEECAR